MLVFNLCVEKSFKLNSLSSPIVISMLGKYCNQVLAISFNKRKLKRMTSKVISSILITLKFSKNLSYLQ